FQLPISDCRFAISSTPTDDRVRTQNRQLAIGNRQCLYTLRRFGGRQPLCGIGVVSRMVVTRIPALLIARIADSRPLPGPFTRTSHCCMPDSIALRAASYAACCAANGVPLDRKST